MKSYVTPFTDQLLQLFSRAITDPDPEVLGNSAFAVGLLIEYSEVDLSPHYTSILAALRPLFGVSPESSPAILNAKDNAAGAVGRMIVKNAAALPLDQILPVLISGLPLKNDYLENRPVFRALFHLFRNASTTLLPFIDNILPVFVHVLDPNEPDQLGDEVRAELINLIGALNAEVPQKIQAAGLSVWVPGA